MKNIVVIGAGPAGLTAAYELLKNNNGDKVTVLEASGEIGGISRTVCHMGNRMDIGGHRFFSKDDNVMQWWENIMPLQGEPSFDDKILNRESSLQAGGPDPETEDRVMLVRKRVSRIYYRKKFFDYPISMKWATIRNMGFITTIRAGFSYLYSTVKKLPETSLENFYINRFGRVLYSMFFEGYTEKLWGRHPRDISADWGAQRTKGLSIKAIIVDMFSKIFVPKSRRKVETSLIEEFWYPKFGPGHLWETVAGEVEKMGGVLQKESAVVGFERDASGKVTFVCVKKGNDGQTEKLPADIVISSMPLKDLINGMPGVPDEVARIAHGLPYRDFVTVGLLTDKLNLKNETKMKTLGDIVPDCWIYVQDTNVKLGRIQIFNNWSPYMVKDPQRSVWIGLEYFCNENDSFWNMSDEECVDLAVGELIKMGVINSADNVIMSHREKVKKAYPAYFDTYYEIDKLVEYINSIDNLYCVGRNGQHRYNNMDHSMVTAFETVKDIRSGSADKTNIWSVNTEKEYHEEK